MFTVTNAGWYEWDGEWCVFVLARCTYPTWS